MSRIRYKYSSLLGQESACEDADAALSCVSKGQIVLEPEQNCEPWNWQEMFGNSNPVEVEVGFGTGGFLVDSCQARRGCNFVGLETSTKMVLHTNNRLEKRGLGNVRLLRADAHYVLARLVEPASLQAVHVYFPDPWPKKRHRKHRVLKPEFLQVMADVIRPGGMCTLPQIFRIISRETVELFKQHPAFISKDPTEWVRERPKTAITNYEAKYRQEGRPIYYALYERGRGD